MLEREAVWFEAGALTEQSLRQSVKMSKSEACGTDEVGARTYFRHDERCMYAKDLNLAATQQAGCNVWIPLDRGYCWRSVWTDQKACPVSEPGPNSGDPHAMVDATVPSEQGGQRTNNGPIHVDDHDDVAQWKQGEKE